MFQIKHQFFMSGISCMKSKYIHSYNVSCDWCFGSRIRRDGLAGHVCKKTSILWCGLQRTFILALIWRWHQVKKTHNMKRLVQIWVSFIWSNFQEEGEEVILGNVLYLQWIIGEWPGNVQEYQANCNWVHGKTWERHWSRFVKVGLGRFDWVLALMADPIHYCLITY